MNDLLSKIQKNMADFSKGQKQIARYIADHYDKAAFMTASKLGQTVGVSESTVVRFATELGYDGYPHLQKALQEMIRNRLTSVQRMEVATDRMGNQDILRMVLNSDVEKIRLTLDELDKNMFAGAVQAILKARKIYILGVRSASVLSNFLGFYFGLIFDNVGLVTMNDISEVYEQLLRINDQDVIIGISFPRYSTRTLKALKYAKTCHAEVVAITDSLFSPLIKYADYTLIAKSDMVSFVDSLVAPLSLINALIAAVGMAKRDEVTDIFAKLENIWEEYQVYEKMENE